MKLNGRVWSFYRTRESELQLRLGYPEEVRDVSAPGAKVAKGYGTSPY
jgi:hypothetical protein